MLITLVSHEDQIVKERAADKTNRCYHRYCNLVTTKSGGGERDRTDDPLLAKQVLSQLSYTPVKLLFAATVVGLVGFEPTTPALSRRCSNRLSYRPRLSSR